MDLVRRCGILAVLGAGACSLYSATNPAGEGGGGDAGADVVPAPPPPPPEMPTDASAADATDGAKDAVAGVELLQNGDFETAGCVGWTTGGSMTTSSDEATTHSGAHACAVCGSGTIWDLHQSVAVSVPAGGRFAGSVWVRASSLTPSMPVQVVVKAADGSQMTALMSIDTTWTNLAPAVVVAAVGGSSVSMQIAAGGSGCIAVDDATIVELP